MSAQATRVANTATQCGCVSNFPGTRNGIVYCPLHAAAWMLLKACKEIRDVCVVLFQLVDAHDLSQEMEERLIVAGLQKGFGVRAQTAIQKAKGKP